MRRRGGEPDYTVLHGYDIVAQRGTVSSPNKAYSHAWGAGSELPNEWEETITDPAVASATLYASSRRGKRYSKGKIVASYEQDSGVEEDDEE